MALMIAATPHTVLTQAAAWLSQGQPVVLITLVGIDGATARGVGSVMVVRGDGIAHGSLSGGCIEAALAAEAQATLARGCGGVQRYGKGSPWIDLPLPCGGGIDLLFTPLWPEGDGAAVVARVLAASAARQPIGLRLHAAGLAEASDAGHADGFVLPLAPRLRLLLLGQGEELLALARLAHGFGAEVEAHTPRAPDQAALAQAGIAAHLLRGLGSVPALAGDAWTAVVFLFHDREWEAALLPQVLRLPALWHGAVGSKRTHAARLAQLRGQGFDDAALARLRGPIGLIPATRDPATLALSILAEVVSAAQATRAAPEMADA